MLKRFLAKVKHFQSHSVNPSDLQPGDHIYVWRNMKHILMYQHHGVYIGNGRCIHFTTRADALAYDNKENNVENTSNNQKENAEQQSSDIEKQQKLNTDGVSQAQQQVIIENVLKYDRKSKNFQVQNSSTVDSKTEAENQQKKPSLWDRINPQSQINKAVIMETSLDYFLYGGKLKRARYNTHIIEYFLKSAGTCYTDSRVDGKQTVEAAKQYICPTNDKGQKEIYSLKSNNCEHLVLEWTTGKRQSYQLGRLFRRLTYGTLFFFPIYKINDHYFFDLFEHYIKVTVAYETALSYWVYIFTFLL